MELGKVKTNRWQISLKMILGLVAVCGVELWIVQQGLAWLVFAPLIVAVFLEATGHPREAHDAGILTVVFWLGYPFLWAFVRGIDV
jgi:hypothetical protein